MSTEVRALIKCETQADGIRVKQVLEGLQLSRRTIASRRERAIGNVRARSPGLSMKPARRWWSSLPNAIRGEDFAIWRAANSAYLWKHNLAKAATLWFQYQG